MARYDGKILMIDDEQDLLKLSNSILRREGFAVETRSDAREALALLREETFDIILLDLHMPEMSGLEFLRQLNVRERPEEVLILTAYADLQSAVETVKLGTYGYLAKPFNAEEIISHINNIRELQKLRAENERLRQAQGTGLGIVGETEQMRQIYRPGSRRGLHPPAGANLRRERHRQGARPPRPSTTPATASPPPLCVATARP